MERHAAPAGFNAIRPLLRPLFMLLFACLLVLASPIAAAHVPDETVAPASRAARILDEQTNLRTGPGTAYRSLAKLDAQVRVQLLARHKDWVQVAAADAPKGWVRADMLDTTPAVLDTLPVVSHVAPPAVWVWPTRGELTSGFGGRRVPFRSFHNGIDIANRSGTAIRAARAGVVTEAGWCRGYGYCVKIGHSEGFSTIYGHLRAKPVVHVGDEVAVGDVLGGMGMTFDRKGGGAVTGVHLHFAILLNGTAVNPLKYLP